MAAVSLIFPSRAGSGLTCQFNGFLPRTSVQKYLQQRICRNYALDEIHCARVLRQQCYYQTRLRKSGSSYGVSVLARDPPACKATGYLPRYPPDRTACPLTQDPKHSVHPSKQAHTHTPSLPRLPSPTPTTSAGPDPFAPLQVTSKPDKPRHAVYQPPSLPQLQTYDKPKDPLPRQLKPS